MDDNRWASRMILAIGGLIGLVLVAGLQAFAAITAPVKAWSIADHLLFSVNALPFAYYIFRAYRAWPEHNTTVKDSLVHVAWAPAFIAWVSNGNLELPVFMVAIFIVFTTISQQNMVGRPTKDRHS